MRTPVLISLAAAATTGGVRRFNVPSWSVLPNLPHALPGGPAGSSGSEVNGGRARDGSETGRSSVDIEATENRFVICCLVKDKLRFIFSGP